MLSNSNVFILLILVKHSTLFGLILANTSAAATSNTTIATHTVIDGDGIQTPNVATTLSSSNATIHYANASTLVIAAEKAENRKYFELNSTSIEQKVAETSTHLAASTLLSHPLLLSSALAQNEHARSDDVPLLRSIDNGTSKNGTSSTSTVASSKTNHSLATAIDDAAAFSLEPLSKLKKLSSNSSGYSSSKSHFINNNNSNNNNLSVSTSHLNSNENDFLPTDNNIRNGGDGDDGDDDEVDNELPQADASLPIDLSTMSRSPEFPQHSDAVYFIVAVSGGAKIWSRTLTRTLIDIGPPFRGSSQGSPLRPIYIDLPANGRFSVKVLLSLCQQTEKRPLAGVVVIGNGQSAHAVALSGAAMQLPVLWAKGGTANLLELHRQTSTSMEALLQPSANEILAAIRALFLQTHWHSFFVLSDVQATLVMRNAEGNPLKRPPLVPTILPLPRNNDDVFKQLAQISRSTRGVIVLFCDLKTTRKIMSEAQRLNMVGGHFIWLWVDTSSTTDYFDQSDSRQQQQQHTSYPQTFGSISNTHAVRKSHVDTDLTAKRGETGTSNTRIVNKQHNVVSSVTFTPITEKSHVELAEKKSPYETDDDESTDSSATGGGERVKVNRMEEEIIDFSQGFDPFRIKQRQDEKLKQGYQSQQHFQLRNPLRDKQSPPNHLILGLRGESGIETDAVNSKKSRRNSESHKHYSSNDYNSGKDEFYEIHENEDTSSTNFFTGDDDDDNDDDDDDDEAPVFISNQTNSSDSNFMRSKYRNFSDDHLFDYLIDNNNFNKPTNARQKLNFKRTSAAVVSDSKHFNSSSPFVFYHHFKDFPVGLLALRPMRMNVDRHFIRAAVRVFAVTWNKINAESRQKKYQSSVINAAAGVSAVTTPPSSVYNRQKQPQNVRNRNAHIATTNLYNSKKSDGQVYSRKLKRKRNIYTVNELLAVAIEKRSVNASTASETEAVEQQEHNQQHQQQQQNIKMQVNRSLFVKNISHYSDNHEHTSVNNSRSRNNNIDESMKLNSSFSSDLINNNKNNNNNSNNSDSLTKVNSTFNQNLSGLWKQNRKTKSNNRLLLLPNSTQLKTPENQSSESKTLATTASLIVVTNTTKQQDNDTADRIIATAKHASQSIITNFFDGDDAIRIPLNKRQNTWWSTKKEIPPSTPNQRPQQPQATNNNNQWQQQHKLHNQNNNPHSHGDADSDALKCETPHYLGGCYGNPNKQDVKNAEYFARALREASKLALSGQSIYNGLSERSLTTNFDLLNLVPAGQLNPLKAGNDPQTLYDRYQFPAASKPDAKRTANVERNSEDDVLTKWRRVGLVSGSSVRLDTIVWPGGDIVVSGLSARARSVFRIVTALAPPFVMESELDEDGLCLRGLPCHRVSPVGRHNLTLMFNAIETRDRLEEDAVEHGNDLPPEPEHLDEKISHITKCCYGLSMDLLDNIATELGFEFHLYVVRDQLFGSKQQRNVKDFMRGNKKQSSAKSTSQHQQPHQPITTTDQKTSQRSTSTSNTMGHTKNSGASDDSNADDDDHWNGIIGDLVAGSADMSFAPLSVSKARAQVIDFSVPYFHSGVSLLASPKTKSEIPLLAFLLPFSPELWIAIFTSLNITAVAVAVYEWLSPFGLNPWGRQRSKNFSLSSALWVMWGLLCGHLVAFKAPKSWPNKFLINVWGGFSVIFVASYTANIAALIAGLFFHHAASSYDSSLTTQRVGAPIASAAESYVQNKDQHLWEHMKKYSLNHIEDGIRGLKNGTLDLLMADSPILDYYRATDHGCSLQRIGETFVEDTYAIGMVKGFPLKESISALIAKYSSNGYLDILSEKWYGGLPCFKYEAEIVTPRPLGVAAVAGVFLLLGLGMVMGVVILIFEHWFYKYALPSLRLKPKGTIWKSRNIMFFSQKLYRFINCVELVSPHHAARELVHSIRQGQIASLFQKSIKRKEDEQRRRRKSKAQFFEMIQEIRRAQQIERENLAAVAEVDSRLEGLKSPPSLFKPKASPKPRLFAALKKDGRSRSNSSVLSIRRYSTDSILGDRMDSIGRRLSRDLTNSPPDLGHRFETFGKNERASNKFDTISGGKLSTSGISKSNEILSNRYDTFSGKNCDKPSIPIKLKKTVGKRPKISFESYHREKLDGQSDKEDREYELPPVKEGLEPPFLQEDRSIAILRHKLHNELRAKYPPNLTRPTTATEIATNRNNDRPPLPKKTSKHQQQRQKSLDNLDVKNGSSNQLKTSPLKYNLDDGNLTKVNQCSQISFERLSREDLLRLSHSSQSEIHEYLKNSMPDRPAEPP